MKPVPPVTRMVFFIFRLWNRGGKHARRSSNLFYDFSSDHMPSASSGWLWCGEVTNYFVISILQKTTFFVPYVVKLFRFAAIHLKSSSFAVQNGENLRNVEATHPQRHTMIYTFRFVVFDFYYLPVHLSFQSAPYKKMPLLYAPAKVHNICRKLHNNSTNHPYY